MRNGRTKVTIAVGLSTLALAALTPMLTACLCGPDIPEVIDGEDLFVVGLEDAPGGAFLAADGYTFPDGLGGGHAYIVGGYVGVDRDLVPDGKKGRLVRSLQPTTFDTACRTDDVLWWVSADEDGAVAVGENGAVLTYSELTNECEEFDIGGVWPDGKPTLYGVDRPYLVGGVGEGDSQEGVLLRWSGDQFTRVELPASVEGNTLFKVAHVEGEYCPEPCESSGDSRVGVRYFIVGEGGVSLTLAPGGSEWERLDTRALHANMTLFTVHCASWDDGSAGYVCIAVGGRTQGVALMMQANSIDEVGEWEPIEIGDVAPLRGVHINSYGLLPQGTMDVFMVGLNGASVHFNGNAPYVSPEATVNAIHAVAQLPFGTYAMGGQLGNTAADQSATLLTRVSASEFTLDNQVYPSTGGDLRRFEAGFSQ